MLCESAEEKPVCDAHVQHDNCALDVLIALLRVYTGVLIFHKDVHLKSQRDSLLLRNSAIA